MANQVWGWMLVASSVLGVTTFLLTRRRRAENESAVWLMLLCIASTCWTVSQSLFFLLESPSQALLFLRLRYCFTTLSAWFTCFFVYRMLMHRLAAAKFVALLCLIPAMDITIQLTNGGEWFITYIMSELSSGLRSADTAIGPWFVSHCVIAYAPILLSIFLLAKQYFRMPPKYKSLMILMFVGIVLVAFTTFLPAIDTAVADFSPFAAQIMLVLFYYALFGSKSTETMFASRDAFFENSDSLLFMLDSDGIIVDFNPAAKKIAKRAGYNNPLGIKADDFVVRWQAEGHCRRFEHDPSIFTVVEGEADKHYQLQRHDITGRKGEIRGTYLEVKNITPIMSMVHMLQDAAYYDNLTGLPNRNFFAHKQKEIDNEDSYPLCVMVGDVNGLKIVNDTYGHVKGDELLKTISSTLISCAPDGAFFARFGGDEFVGLLPLTDAAGANGYIAKVEASCAGFLDASFRDASISLGFKLKTKTDESIEDLIKAADYEMYTTKRDRRAARA